MKTSPAAIVVAMVLMLTGCTDGGTVAPTTSTVDTTTSMPATTTLPPGPEDLAVMVAGGITAEALMADVRALAATPRATDAEREATRTWLEQQLAAAGYAVQRWTRADTSQSPVVAVNLVARYASPEQPPAEIERVVLLTAHYDSVDGVPGADDNASGVAVLLATARALADTAPVLGATIELVLFDVEERGLLGSQPYAAEALGGRDVVGVLNLESVGYTCAAPCQVVFSDIAGCLVIGGDPATDAGESIVVVGDETADSLISAFEDGRALAAPDLDVVAGLVAGNGSCMSVTRRSDHAPFWDAGVPALMITDTAEFRNANYHQPTDAPGTLDPAFLEAVARSTAAAVVLLAA